MKIPEHVLKRLREENIMRRGKTIDEIYGKKRADEIRKKSRIALKKRVEAGEYTEERMRPFLESRKGVKPMLGKKHTEETKKKMSLASKSIKKSEEHIKSMKESWKRRKENPNYEEYTKKVAKGVSDFWWSLPLEERKRRTLKGEKSSNWRGGISFEPYGLAFNNKFRKAIRERDMGCMLCNINFEDLKLLKRKVNVHHIDYVKTNNFPQNCVSLCVRCHGLTNRNRAKWKTFFQQLMKERYSYEYTEDQKVILDFIC